MLTKEEKTFARTLRKGLSAMRRLGRSGAALDGKTLFELHDTFGMPVELCRRGGDRSGIPLSADAGRPSTTA